METLPQNLEAERAVIATLAISPEYWKYAKHLTPEYFLDIQCNGAFQQMVKYQDEERNWLEDDDWVVDWFTNGMPVHWSHQFEELVKRIEESYICRAGYLLAKDMARAAIAGDVSGVERALSIKLPSLSQEGLAAPDLVDMLKENLGNQDGEIIKSGFGNLDAVGMLRRKEGLGLAARPSMGKSQLMAQISGTVAREGIVVVWSGEMAAERWVSRMVSSLAGASLRYAEVGDDRFDKAFASVKELENLYIFDKPMTSLELASQCRRIADKHGQLDLVIVDHIRLLRDPHDSEVQRLGVITRNMRDIAKELNCCSANCIQLNRLVESRIDKHPELKDLRDSGQIEENLDTIVFLYRDAYYTKRDKPNEQSGTAQLYTRKNREGRHWAKRLWFAIDDGPRFAEMQGGE